MTDPTRRHFIAAATALPVAAGAAHAAAATSDTTLSHTGVSPRTACHTRSASRQAITTEMSLLIGCASVVTRR